MTKAHKLAAKEQLSEIGKLQKKIREKTDDFSTMITSIIDLACLFACIYSMDPEEEVSIQHLVARLFLPSLFLVIGRNAAMALFRHTAIVQGFNSKNLHTLTSQEAQLYITELQAQAKKIESIHFKGGVSLAVLMFIQMIGASKRIKQIIATAGTCAAIGYVPPEFTLECVRKKNYKNLMLEGQKQVEELYSCLLYTSPSPRD